MKIRLFHLPVILPEHAAPRGPFINLMTMGLMALADRLDREGHQVEVVHAGVEQRLDSGFDAVQDAASGNPDLVGFSLQWHHQIGPVAGTVERLHARQPGLKVVLGGMTASAFASEIISRWPGVDYVIRGEGEEPLAVLVSQLSRGEAMGTWVEDVPNLTYRKEGRPKQTPFQYVAGQQDLDGLSFCRLDLLRHAECYNAQFARTCRGWSHAPVFYLGTGRGCTVDCAFCSGGRSGHWQTAGRRAPVFRSVARVIDDLVKLAAHSIRTVCVCFDPPPLAERYYLELFEAVRGEGLGLSMVFECYGPPSRRFLESFSQTFRPESSRISFSPTVGDETLRSSLLGVGYSNRELERALQDCRELGVPTTLYFATVPQESLGQLEHSLKWQAGLAARYGCRLVHSPIEMEPLAPWYGDPDTYGLTNVRKGFDAFERRHRDAPTLGVRYAEEVGYDFPDVDARVVRISSALADPGACLGRAVASCGQGTSERQILVGTGQLERALRILGHWRGSPMAVFLSNGEADPDQWDFLKETAVRLGPNVRIMSFSPDSIRHVSWDGQMPTRSWPPDLLVVLHLRDAAAARNLVRSGWAALERLPDQVLLAETCRWTGDRCPALRMGMLALGRDGTTRCCLSCPDLGRATVAEIAQHMVRRAGEIETKRGCEQCAVRDRCARCLYCGPVLDDAYCDIQRLLGDPASGFRPFPRIPDAQRSVAIGWDE